MKIKITAFILLVFTVFSACKKEEDLTPSYADTDRVASLVDVSIPLVQHMYETYGKGILYEFDDTLDFYYIADTKSVLEKWVNVSITHLDADSALATVEFLDSTLFAYLKEEPITFNGTTYNLNTILKYIPYKILLSDGLNATSKGLMSSINNSDARATADGKGVLHAIGNKQSFAFNLDLTTITVSEAKMAEFKQDNFFLFLTHIFEQQNFYDSLPQAFYEGCSTYYGEEVGEVYETEGYTADEYGIVDKDWFLSKGFVDARYFYSLPDGLSDVRVGFEVTERVIYSDIEFIDNDQDFANSYLNQLIFSSEDEFSAYPEIVQEKMVIMVEWLLEYGVDIVSFNPAIAVLFTE